MKSSQFKALAAISRKRITKTESQRYWYLRGMKESGEIWDVRHKPLRLNLTDPLPGKRTLVYEPDLLVIEVGGAMWFEELKPAKKDGKPVYLGDARTKVLTAARVFPFWGFRVVWFFGGEWKMDNL